jgi:tetratricopeptide (TPR) repeat protein
MNCRICLILIVSFLLFSCSNNKEQVKDLKLKAISNIYNNQNDAAKETLEKALKKDPTDPEIYYLLGNICFNEKKYDEAMKYYNKTIELDSTYAQAYTSRGKIYRIYNDRDKWCENFVKAYQLGDNTVYNDVRHCIP